MVISRTIRRLVPLEPTRSSLMEAEGAENLAPDEEPSGTQASASPAGVAAASAPVISADSSHPCVAPDASLGEGVKEEEVDFSPVEESNIVGEFLGAVETLDLLGLDDPNPQLPPSHCHPSVRVLLLARQHRRLAILRHKQTTPLSLKVLKSAVPSRPPRTRGARGGKYSQYKYYIGELTTRGGIS